MIQLYPDDDRWLDATRTLVKRVVGSHRYYLINRPPSIGCQPDGVIDREVWQPTKRMPNSERYAHGWVEYAQPIDFEQVWRYDMLPASQAEHMAYIDWREEVGK